MFPLFIFIFLLIEIDGVGFNIPIKFTESEVIQHTD